MWIVTIYDDDKDENIDVIAYDLDELIKILTYVKSNDVQLSLNSVEERWMSCGLDGLKEIVEDDKGNNIPDKI